MNEEPLPPGFVLEDPLPPGFVLEQPKTQEGPAHPAGALGQALYDAIAHAVKQNAPGVAQVAGMAADDIHAPLDFARGLARFPTPADATAQQRIIQAAGRGALPAAGALAAGAALPIVAPVAAAASPLLAGAAATGLGAAAGDLAQEGVARVAGGAGPDTLPDALSEAGKTGLTAAATDLGLGVIAKTVAKVAPKLVSMFKTFPKEGLKRTLQRPDEVLSIIDGVKDAQSAAESEGVKALREVQNGLTMARHEAGKQVEQALGQFQIVTKGKPIIDGFEIAGSGADALSSRSTSEGMSAITETEITKIGKLIEDLNKQGPMSARDAVIWRRKLDNLIDYKRGAIPEITSGEGQGVVSQMANALRQQIRKAAEDNGFTPLAEANKTFSKIAQAYDAYRPAFNTKTSLGGEAVRRLEALERSFNKGGLPQSDLTEIGQSIPILQKPVDRLLDSIVARRLTLESAGSQSGMTMTAIRFLAGPDGLAVATNAARKAPIREVRNAAGAVAAGARGMSK